MSRICSCGQDLDRSSEPVKEPCGCICSHIRRNPCKMHWDIVAAEMERAFGYQWKYEIKEIKWDTVK